MGWAKQDPEASHSFGDWLVMPAMVAEGGELACVTQSYHLMGHFQLVGVTRDRQIFLGGIKPREAGALAEHLIPKPIQFEGRARNLEQTPHRT